MYRLLLLIPLWSFALATEAPPASAARPAVWKIHELTFSYRSEQAFYPCAALQRRVQSIFLLLGARDDLQVRVSNCDDHELSDAFDPYWRRDSVFDDDRWRQGGMGGMGGMSGWDDPYGDGLDRRRRKREQLAYVRVRAMMPVELTREVLAEIDRDKSRRELISRVTGDPTAGRNDPVVFPAQRQPVELSRKTLGLKAGECELLEQMAASVFKQLKMRVTERSATCGRYRVSRIVPEMTVETLVGVPVGTTSLPQLDLEALPEGVIPSPAAEEPADEPPQ